MMDVPRELSSKAVQQCVLALRVEEAGRALSVCRALRDNWSAEELWEILLLRDFGLETATGTDRRETFCVWHFTILVSLHI